VTPPRQGQGSPPGSRRQSRRLSGKTGSVSSCVRPGGRSRSLPSVTRPARRSPSRSPVVWLATTRARLSWADCGEKAQPETSAARRAPPMLLR
jgi:hypothetical protein